MKEPLSQLTSNVSNYKGVNNKTLLIFLFTMQHWPTHISKNYTEKENLFTCTLKTSDNIPLPHPHCCEKTLSVHVFL